MKKRLISLLVFLTLGLAQLPIASANSNKSAVVTFKVLSLDSARQAAWASIADCRKRGYSVAVAVVDRGGNVQALYRDRFAGPHTVQTAIRKAYTAVSFRQSTNDLAGLLKSGKIPSQVQHNPGALLVGGGEMVKANGETIGAIGVSGAPPGKTERDSIDGQCAKAGIKKIREALDFSD